MSTFAITLMSTWLSWSRRFAQRPQRERFMLFATAAAVIAFSADSLVLKPLGAKLVVAKQQQRKLDEQLRSLRTQDQLLQVGAALPRESERNALKAELVTLGDQVNRLGAVLVSSDRMPEFLRGLLPGAADPASGAVRMLSMRTMPQTEVSPGSAKALASAAAAPTATRSAGEPAAPASSHGVYRHGLEIKLEGSYPQLHKYVLALEKSTWKLLVDRAFLEVRQYPQCVLTLRVYTFSLEPQWLQLGS